MPEGSEKSLAPQVATIEGTKVRTQEDMLKKVRINLTILNDEDVACIRQKSLNQTDPEDDLYKRSAFSALIKELRNNTETRGEKFGLLVELGLLVDKADLPSSRLLTQKGADFLGIDFGKWMMSPEVLRAVEHFKQTIAATLHTFEQRSAWDRVCENILNLTPELGPELSNKMPIRNYIGNLIGYLKANLSNTLVEIMKQGQGDIEMIDIYKRIGWIRIAANQDKNMQIKELLTDRGSQVLDLCSESD